MKTANPTQVRQMSAMTIVFPIHIRMQRAENTISIVDATQLLDCIDSLSETDAQILYPILMTDPYGYYTVVRNDAQLEKLMTINNTNT